MKKHEFYFAGIGAALLVLLLPAVLSAASMPVYDMASLYGMADVVVEVRKFSYRLENGEYHASPKIKRAYRGKLRVGQTIPIVVNTIYRLYLSGDGPKTIIDRDGTRMEHVPPKLITTGALLFLKKEKGRKTYRPVSSGIKFLRQKDVLRYAQPNNPGPYVLLQQKPEFLKLRKGAAYGVRELRKDLRLAVGRVGEFRRIERSGNIRRLRQYLISSYRPLYSLNGRDFFSEAALKRIIELADSKNLRKTLRFCGVHLKEKHWKCEYFTVMRLREALKRAGK